MHAMTGTLFKLYQGIAVSRVPKPGKEASVSPINGEVDGVKDRRTKGVVAQIQERLQSSDGYFPPLVFPEGCLQTHNATISLFISENQASMATEFSLILLSCRVHH